MADRREDSTRELIGSAEALLSKGGKDSGKDSTMERLVAEADAIMGTGKTPGRKAGSSASTRELVAHSEDILSGKRGGAVSRGGKAAKEGSGDRSGIIFAAVAIVAIIAAAAAYFVMQGGN